MQIPGEKYSKKLEEPGRVSFMFHLPENYNFFPHESFFLYFISARF